MMKFGEIAFFAIVASAFLTIYSCSTKDAVEGKERTEYLPVKFGAKEYWSIVNSKAQVVVKEEYVPDAEISYVFRKSYWVQNKKSEQWQLYSVDSPKKPLCDDCFDYATGMCANRSAVSKSGEPIQLIDSDGKLVATLSKDIIRVQKFSESGYAVCYLKSGRMGWIDSDGKIVHEGEYNDINISPDGTIVVSKPDQNDNSSYILDSKGNQTGRLINVDTKMSMFSEDLMPVKFEEGAGYVGKDGTTQLKVKNADDVGEFVDGMAVFNRDEKWGVIDRNGEIVIRPKYNSLHNMGNGIFCAETTPPEGTYSGKYGAINAKDEIVIPFDYDYFWDTHIGDNILFKQEKPHWSYFLLGLDGKEVNKEEFIDISYDRTSESAYYHDVDAIADTLVMAVKRVNLSDFPADVAKRLKLKPDTTNITKELMESFTACGLDCGVKYEFLFNTLEEKYRTVDVNDGEITEESTIRDGWTWSESPITKVYVSSWIWYAASVRQMIVKKIKEKLVANGYKQDDTDENALYKTLKGGVLSYLQIYWEDHTLFLLMNNPNASSDDPECE